MTSKAPITPRTACAENVSLLYLLHSVPTRPSTNPVSSFLINRKGYTLSFQEERSLSGTLAYLSNVKDDPSHIPAVCIEERPESASLNVLLSVNKATPSDGHGTLRSLKQDFERIFALLSRIRTGEWAESQHHFLLLISLGIRWPSKYPRGHIFCNHLHVLGSHPLPTSFRS
jgi:hypothetical protein